MFYSVMLQTSIILFLIQFQTHSVNMFFLQFQLWEGFTFTAVIKCKSWKCHAGPVCPAFVFGPSRPHADISPVLYQDSLSFFMMKPDEI